MSDESTTLFLGDLSVFCTEKDIRKLFRPFGTIEAIRVKRGSSSKTNLSYGFIKFSTRESAETALEQLTGIMFLGRALRIGWAEGKNTPKPPPVAQESNKGAVETAQVHVSFISKQIDVLISEATLRALFGLYGEVIDVALKKSQFDRNLRIQNGYGFVHYPLTQEGIQAAFNAVSSLHQVTIDRVTYDCSVSHALEEMIVPPTGSPKASPAAVPKKTVNNAQQLPQNVLLHGQGSVPIDSTIPTPVPVLQFNNMNRGGMHHGYGSNNNLNAMYPPPAQSPQQQYYYSPQQQQQGGMDSARSASGRAPMAPMASPRYPMQPQGISMNYDGMGGFQYQDPQYQQQLQLQQQQQQFAAEGSMLSRPPSGFSLLYPSPSQSPHFSQHKTPRGGAPLSDTSRGSSFDFGAQASSAALSKLTPRSSFHDPYNYNTMPLPPNSQSQFGATTGSVTSFGSASERSRSTSESFSQQTSFDNGSELFDLSQLSLGPPIQSPSNSTGSDQGGATTVGSGGSGKFEGYTFERNNSSNSARGVFDNNSFIGGSSLGLNNTGSFHSGIGGVQGSNAASILGFPTPTNSSYFDFPDATHVNDDGGYTLPATVMGGNKSPLGTFSSSNNGDASPSSFSLQSGLSGFGSTLDPHAPVFTLGDSLVSGGLASNSSRFFMQDSSPTSGSSFLDQQPLHSVDDLVDSAPSEQVVSSIVGEGSTSA